MGHGRVNGENEVQAIDNGGSIGKPLDAGAQIEDRGDDLAGGKNGSVGEEVVLF